MVNFGAAKITVYGNVRMEAIEEAGAFENIKLIKETDRFETNKQPFIRKHWNVAISGLFLLFGWMGHLYFGEESLLVIFAFILSMIVGGYRLFSAGLKNLVRLQFDMRTLMTIAIIGAALIGEWGEGATVVILFAISEVLEAYSMDKARQSIQSLMDITPKEALIRRNGREISVHVDEIQVNDIMIVKPGEKIAMDGLVLEGTSSINQAAITGESMPVIKTEGDNVYAGTLNEEGLLEIAVTKRVEDTTLAKIIHLVEEAQAERAPSQAFVDRFAKYYTPLIMLIAVLVALIPPVFLGGDWSSWIYQGLAVLVVGCPCALVISTPVSIVTAIGNAARNGVLIKGGIYLEEMGALRAIAFDKTGTLTKGIPTVTNVININGEEQENLKTIAAIEKGSNHPLSSAILSKAREEKISFDSIPVTQFISITGKGIKANVNGKTYVVGSPKLFDDFYDMKDVNELVERFQSEGNTIVLFGNEENILSIITIQDEVRENSGTVIQLLHKLGIKETVMLTGDNEGTARLISKKVGVTQTASELLPEEKLAYIKKLRDQYGKVGMVGDGINDAPALAAASVGIAMGGAGTDTALETADIALMGDDLKKLPFTVKLSRKALHIIKQNIVFSIGIKLFALLLVVPGWLTLWIAIFADMGATLIVTLNALRLLRVRDVD